MKKLLVTTILSLSLLTACASLDNSTSSDNANEQTDLSSDETNENLDNDKKDDKSENDINESADENTSLGYVETDPDAVYSPYEFVTRYFNAYVLGDGNTILSFFLPEEVFDEFARREFENYKSYEQFSNSYCDITRQFIDNVHSDGSITFNTNVIELCECKKDDEVPDELALYDLVLYDLKDKYGYIEDDVDTVYYAKVQVDTTLNDFQAIGSVNLVFYRYKHHYYTEYIHSYSEILTQIYYQCEDAAIAYEKAMDKFQETLY